MWMFTYLAITLAVLYSASRILKWRRLPPGPWGLPIVGYLPFLNPKAPHETLNDLAIKYGKIFGINLGNIYTVVISDAKMITSAFSNDKITGRAPLYLTHGIMQGYGLICAEGQLWKVHRKFALKCMNLFGGGKVRTQQRDTMESMILKQAADFVKATREEIELDSEINPFNILQHNVGSLMTALVFGKIWARDDPTWKWLLHLQEDGTKAIGVAGPLNFLPFLRHIPKFKKLMQFLLDGKYKTHEIYKKIIEAENENFDVRDFNVVPQNLIQAYLRERILTTNLELFDDDQFHHFIADIFGAGFDTTIATLQWFIFYMASESALQEELGKEIDTVIQNRVPTYDNLSDMPFTRACITEIQRIRSVVPTGIPHATNEDITIFGYNIPKGTMIMPFQWTVHMSEALWTDPRKFNPTRFLDGRGHFKKPENFIPFQTGKRMCIGDEFANMILFLFATTLFQNFMVSSSGSIDLEGELGITLTPKQQKLIFVERKKESWCEDY